jgi:hypothetical protein|tara:strand:+ start:653 stop:1018 length:366 start_codon:yes stop_codon:yes gene_type:complete
MSDYTIEELQQMLNDKIQEEVVSGSVDPIQEFMNSIDDASDYETEKIRVNNIIVGHINKSQSNNKKYIEQRHYINEMERGQVVGRSISYVTYETGSYSSNLTTPTLQIVGERPIDRTVLKG